MLPLLTFIYQVVKNTINSDKLYKDSRQFFGTIITKVMIIFLRMAKINLISKNKKEYQLINFHLNKNNSQDLLKNVYQLDRMQQLILILIQEIIIIRIT
jgi:hypothetical protein